MQFRSLIIPSLAWASSLVLAAWLGLDYGQTTPSASHRSENAAVGSTSPKPLANQLGDSADPAPTAKLGRDDEATTKPTHSMTAILDMEDPVDKMSAFLDLVRSLQTNQTFEQAALALTENFDPRGRGRELNILMTEWAKLDPKAALAVAGDRLGDWPGRMASGTVLTTWSKTDAVAAKAWALEKGAKFGGDEGNWYMSSVVSGLASKDLALAATWAQEQPRSKARGEMIDKLLDAYTKQRGLAATDEWVMNLEPGPFREGATRRLAARLSEKDPASAAVWITGLPSGEGKAGAMSELVNRWTEKDPNATGTWLKNFPPSEETDEPRSNFAWNIREQDPESALAWAGTIYDPKRRDKAVSKLVRDWSKRDPRGAQDYMTRNQWPDETRQRTIN